MDIIQKENKKVKNATVIIAHGIRFKSNLELTMFNLLKMHKFDFKYEEMTFVIVPSFFYRGVKIQQIGYTPDFTLVLNDILIIIETKGRPNDSWPIREKLFKKHLVDNNLSNDTIYVMPRNTAQCSSLIRALIDFKEGKPFDFTNVVIPKKKKINFSVNVKHK